MTDADKRVEELELAEFKRRAEKEFSNLPGTEDEKVAALKVIAGIEDEATRTHLDKMLRAGDAGLTYSVFNPHQRTEELRILGLCDFIDSSLKLLEESLKEYHCYTDNMSFALYKQQVDAIKQLNELILKHRYYVRGAKGIHVDGKP